MNILVVGGGGREHALVWKLAQSPAVKKIFCAPGNAGTAALAENVNIPAADLAGLRQFARERRIDLAVVGPDDPLAAGIVDEFEAEGLRVFGPSRSAARLEASKIFAKELMQARGVPTARAETFSDADAARQFCAGASYPLVLKADGLALGKGVIIADNRATAEETVSAAMEKDQFGEAGRRLVLEEFLRGWECSLHALVCGEEFLMLAAARDHKRAHDGNTGPNTGGMGAVSPAEAWDAGLQERFETEIMRPLLRGLQERGIVFRGLLFPGLMVTADGPHVLEFNCRFGDPETQVILPRLQSDLLPLLEATLDGKLAAQRPAWDARAAVTVVMASGGYPGKYETGKTITGLDQAAALPDVLVFHAGTRHEGDKIVTAGGRVLAVTALGKTAAEARAQAYAAVAEIRFEGAFYRRDIGAFSSTP